MPAFIHFVNEYGRNILKKTNKTTLLGYLQPNSCKMWRILPVLVLHKQY